MSTNTWHEELPSDASQVAISPPDMRSHWTSISVGLINTLYWAGSGGQSQLSSGELYMGATRTYVGSLSTSSNGAANLGKLYMSSESSLLLLYESDRTHVVGSPGMVSQASSAFGAVWVEQRRTVSVDGEGDDPFSFTTAYDVAPLVWVTASEADPTGDAYIHAISSVTAGGVVISSRYYGNAVAAPSTIYIMSLGTRSGEF